MRLSLLITGILLYSEVLAEEPCSVRQCSKGHELIVEGNFARAVEVFSVCVQTEEDESCSGKAYKGRAWSYYNLGEYEEAIADQRKGLSFDEEADVPGIINFSLYLKKTGRFQESVEEVEPIVQYYLSQEIAWMPAQYHLAWAYQELDRHQEAIAALTTGLQNQPDYIFAYWRRAKSYDQLELKKEALNDLNRVLELIANAERKPTYEEVEMMMPLILRVWVKSR